MDGRQLFFPLFHTGLLYNQDTVGPLATLGFDQSSFCCSAVLVFTVVFDKVAPVSSLVCQLSGVSSSIKSATGWPAASRFRGSAGG